MAHTVMGNERLSTPFPAVTPRSGIMQVWIPLFLITATAGAIAVPLRFVLGRDGTSTIATLGSGEIFGEMALLLH